jgi:hypothetical protein
MEGYDWHRCFSIDAAQCSPASLVHRKPWSILILAGVIGGVSRALAPPTYLASMSAQRCSTTQSLEG